MFERYTERARRVLFFARYEASQLGSVSIDTEHLLLGLIREGKGLTSRIFARAHMSLESLRKELTARIVFHEKIATSVEIPFSPDAKRALLAAAEEADRLKHMDIATEHVLLGLLHDERSVAGSLLIEKGLRLDAVRNDVVQLLDEEAAVVDQRQGDVSVRVQKRTPRAVRVVILVTKPHDAIEEPLLEGAQQALVEGGIAEVDVTVVPVPGVSEIPMAFRCAAEAGRFDAAICLCSTLQHTAPSVESTLPSVANALQLVAADTGVPFTLGVLTPDSSAAPIEGPARVGYNAATAALEMVTIVRTLRDPDSTGADARK